MQTTNDGAGGSARYFEHAVRSVDRSLIDLVMTQRGKSGVLGTELATQFARGLNAGRAVGQRASQQLSQQPMLLRRIVGIGLVAYSPLGHGFLTGASRSLNDLPEGDWRRTNPRFMGKNFESNLRIAEEVQAIASEVGATPAQVALTWLLAKGSDIAPIPGTRRVSRLEENVAADKVELTPEQIARLDHLPAASGGHHNEAQMQQIER